jgi:membrane protein
MTFAAVIGLGFLLLVSLVVSAALEALGRGWTPHGAWTLALMKTLNLLVSFGGVMAIFMMMFKVLPEARVRWRDLWVGAALTAVLFTAGKFLIGVYLGNAVIGSSYGAASSFVLILLWIYYSSQIVLLGAEFTKAYQAQSLEKRLKRRTAGFSRGASSRTTRRPARSRTFQNPSNGPSDISPWRPVQR